MRPSSQPAPRRRAAAVTAAVLAGLPVCAGVADATPAEDRPFDIGAYHVTIDYQPGDGVLHGSAVIVASANTVLDSFTLRLTGPEADTVSIDGVAAKSVSHNGTDLEISPAHMIAPGTRFRVRVDYAGKPGEGWFPTESGGATAFQGATDTWLPVGDGHDKADFHLTGTAPEGWSVVSVGRELPSPGEGAFRWSEPDVAPDDLAVAVDRFTFDRVTLADGTPVVNAYAAGLEEKTGPLADRMPEIMDFLVGRFGGYPFDDAGNVFVQVSDDGPGTSPQTRAFYLGADSTFMDLNQVVHEQAHQWYGVSVAPRLSEDNCLSECFASYATWMWEEAKEGVDLDARYRDTVNANKADAAYWQGPLYQAGATPGFQIYQRGPLALHALRRQMGEQAFGTLLERWPQRHRGTYVSWPRFERLATKISGQSLTGFFEAWFRATTVPPDRYLWPGNMRP